MDPESGSQPLINDDGSVILSVNGEIYNYKQLGKELRVPYPFKTHSDCEVIIPLYLEGECPSVFLNKLCGMFAFVLYDKARGEYLVARDHMGIMPLYWGVGRDGGMWFASEMKALSAHCVKIETFKPGHMYRSRTASFTRWYRPSWRGEGGLRPEEREAAGEAPAAAEVVPRVWPALNLPALREALERAVIRCMMSDVPWGVLLSGGLDSSLVASIASRHAAEVPGFPRLHSFTIGLEGSPDLAAAARAAAYLGTVHHAYTFTVQQGIDALSEVIYHLETYDVTTVRASTPMFLMSRKIKATGVKMVLSGEGADEVFGGYLYFHKAPNPEELHEETKDKLESLHLFDCLRANKATSAWGLEARVPFLDRDFLDVAMNMNPADKMIDMAGGRIEKWALRSAFDTPDRPYLPTDILWRQKEQFSDGVGYSWIDSLRLHAAEHVSDEQMRGAHYRFPINTPATKEAYFYRSIFEEHYPQETCQRTVPHGMSIACSTRRAMAWHAAFANAADPSGRCVAGVHSAAYKNPTAAAAGDVAAQDTEACDSGEPSANGAASKKHAAVSSPAAAGASPKRARTKE